MTQVFILALCIVAIQARENTGPRVQHYCWATGCGVSDGHTFFHHQNVGNNSLHALQSSAYLLFAPSIVVQQRTMHHGGIPKGNSNLSLMATTKRLCTGKWGCGGRGQGLTGMEKFPGRKPPSQGRTGNSSGEKIKLYKRKILWMSFEER